MGDFAQVSSIDTPKHAAGFRYRLKAKAFVVAFDWSDFCIT